MGFFTEREREELNKSSHATDATSEFVRQQQERKTDDEFRNNDLTSLLQRAAQESLREVDVVITDLQMMREKLHSEASRVQREMVEYATFSESAFQSSKVICESLRTGLRPYQHKGRKEKVRANARRKAATRSASAATRGGTFIPVET